MGPDKMTVGMYYQTEQEHQYDNIHVTSMDGTKLQFTSQTRWLVAICYIWCNQQANVMVITGLVYVDKTLRFNNLGM